ncbi:MAG: ATP-binding cassette domain-containing protein [Prevotella sp.]|nr:ATP-binding cassette domain-containing protein [Prevotella sp.]
MINDTIISGLLNLFALLSVRSSSNYEQCVKLLDNYLGGYFGLRNKQQYLDLYSDLFELYSEGSSVTDKDAIVLQITNNMRGAISAPELKLLYLRLLEFCQQTGGHVDSADQLFHTIAGHFGVDSAMAQVFNDFVEGNTSDQVKLQHFNGYDGYIRTLWIEADHRMLFTYVGHDAVLLNDVPVVAGVFQTWHESCVLKNHKGAPLYYSTLRQAYKKAGNNNVTFSGRNINFRFPNSDNGMHNLSFTLHSGELVAIMGGSGTGKTTLLSLLNGTLKPQQGTLTINGRDSSDPAVKSLIGFVPQDDLLIEELTVYQNLYYTARLCFGKMSHADIDRRVTEVLKSLGLENAKDLKVGSPLNKTISGGQRKRLNIALELIREPAVLMLDEPTSGLSSADTEHVVGLLKEQTYKGRLIIVNIHQPSSEVYKLFDRLWLLDRGGYPVFDGNPIDAITYFKTAANYADAETSTCPTCGNVNPEVVLNIINEKTIDNTGSISDERKTTPQEWHKMYLEQQQAKAAMTKQPNTPTTKQPNDQTTKQPNDQTTKQPNNQAKPGPLKQFVIQLQRNVATKITNRQYMLITLLEAPLLAVVCSWLTRYAPDSGYTLADNKNFVSFLFMAVIVSTFIGMSGSAEEIIRDRSLLKREKFLQLSYSSYISSKITLLAGVTLLQTGLFVLVGQTIMGFNDLFAVWWITLFATAFVASLTGLLLSQCLNSVVAIYISIPLLLIPQILLCGVVVDFNDLNRRSTTGNVPLIGNIIPSRWAYEALAVTTFTSNAHEAQLFDCHRRQYQHQYNRMVYLSELETQLETMHHEQETGQEVKLIHQLVIATELPHLAKQAGLQPYQGDSSYASLKDYFLQADSVFLKRGNAATLEADWIVCNTIKQMGRQAYRQFKASHTNRQLENVLINATAPETFKITDGHIVPLVGQVYLAPTTSDGQAPFYSAYKQLGQAEIPTLWWNLAMLMLMAALTSILIYTDRPGRYLRQ